MITLLAENNKRIGFDKLQFISDNPEFFIRLLNQTKYTHVILDWADDELK